MADYPSFKLSKQSAKKKVTKKKTPVYHPAIIPLKPGQVTKAEYDKIIKRKQMMSGKVKR